MSQIVSGGAAPVVLFGFTVMDFLASFLVLILLVFFCELMNLVGGFVLRAASFGTVRAAPSDVPYRDFNWFWARRNGNGQIEVESMAAGGIGFITVFICLAAFLHFF